ncbi:MAG: MFS transporter [Planctomycetaceae bacterium]|nr:MFS transporter [Planctomycetaceae bacterium]MBT6157577.1 MFS transporter [Planctomycetaceae bacterium]MBT6488022.1 MFS transporter [Planctomycetaceae bacterium]MBT6497839.1 MFS transporter [Planctomycetaceae bacterium]
MDQLLLFAAEGAAKPALEWGLRIPLSTMHFLEFAIWGAWWVILGNYLDSLGFSRQNIGRIYATIPIGSVIAPMFVGTIADRYFASEHVMAVSHLLGAGLLLWMTRIRKPGMFFVVALLYAIVFSPTLAIVNSIVFAHVPDAARDFPTVRVLGTIGWILAGLSLKFVLKPGEPVNNRPILIAAALSLVLGIFSFMLPHTPPTAKEGEIPFLQAFELLNDPSFAVFFGVSFFITIALAFYFSFTAIYLESNSGVKSENIGPLMSIGQIVEIGFMFTLGWFLKEMGMRWVLIAGMAAWGVRYALFAAGRPFVLVLAGIALHGICFDFFFAAGFIHVENTAPKAIQASGQALFAVLTYGLGMWIGSEASGWLNHWATTERTDPETGETIKETNWRLFWTVPCVGVVVCLLAFVLLF